MYAVSDFRKASLEGIRFERGGWPRAYDRYEAADKRRRHKRAVELWNSRRPHISRILTWLEIWEMASSLAMRAMPPAAQLSGLPPCPGRYGTSWNLRNPKREAQAMEIMTAAELSEFYAWLDEREAEFSRRAKQAWKDYSRKHYETRLAEEEGRWWNI
jgi:hypothetical protein